MRRREALAKLTGRERYVDDLPLDDFLWGMTVRSPAPRGRITAIRFGKDIAWSEFVVADHRDIPASRTGRVKHSGAPPARSKSSSPPSRPPSTSARRPGPRRSSTARTTCSSACRS